MIAIQDCYSHDNSHCWGCGKENPEGLHLKSYLHPDGTCHLTHTPDERYTGGVPENLYGGYIAMLFDCHGTASAAALSHQSEGYAISEGTMDRFVTAHLSVDFKRPTPMGCPLEVTARAEQITPRKVVLVMTLRAGDVETATAQMVAVRLAKPTA